MRLYSSLPQNMMKNLLSKSLTKRLNKLACLSLFKYFQPRLIFLNMHHGAACASMILITLKYKSRLQKDLPELFTLVTDEEAKLASVFFPFKYFQPSLIFLNMHHGATCASLFLITPKYDEKLFYLSH